MGMRVRLVVGLLLAGAVVLSAQASAATFRTFPVPTAGFAIGLPSSWIDIAKAAPAVLGRLEKVPSFRAFAQAASQNGSLKLIAADPAGKGTVYMNVGAARLPGPYSVKQVANATAAQLKKPLGRRLGVGDAREALRGARVPDPPGEEGLTERDRRVRAREGSGRVRDRLRGAAHDLEEARGAVHLERRSFRFLPTPNLSKVVLSASQVGKGYKLSSFPFGTSFIGEPTLDLCAATYPSEGLRVGRLQVRYTPKGSGVDVSNEIVRYTSGGAQQALGEVASVARACAQDAGRADSGDDQGGLHGRAAQGSEAAGGHGRGEARRSRSARAPVTRSRPASRSTR